LEKLNVLIESEEQKLKEVGKQKKLIDEEEKNKREEYDSKIQQERMQLEQQEQIKIDQQEKQEQEEEEYKRLLEEQKKKKKLDTDIDEEEDIDEMLSRIESERRDLVNQITELEQQCEIDLNTLTNEEILQMIESEAQNEILEDERHNKEQLQQLNEGKSQEELEADLWWKQQEQKMKIISKLKQQQVSLKEKLNKELNIVEERKKIIEVNQKSTDDNIQSNSVSLLTQDTPIAHDRKRSLDETSTNKKKFQYRLHDEDSQAFGDLIPSQEDSRPLSPLNPSSFMQNISPPVQRVEKNLSTSTRQLKEQQDNSSSRTERIEDQNSDQSEQKKQLEQQRLKDKYHNAAHSFDQTNNEGTRSDELKKEEKANKDSERVEKGKLSERNRDKEKDQLKQKDAQNQYEYESKKADYSIKAQKGNDKLRSDQDKKEQIFSQSFEGFKQTDSSNSPTSNITQNVQNQQNNKDFKAFVTTSSPSPQQAKKTDQNPQLDNSKTPSSLKPKFIPRKSKELDDLYIKKSDGDDRYSSYSRPASQRFQSYIITSVSVKEGHISTFIIIGQSFRQKIVQSITEQE
ncbi:MAG: hypothetical protein EZS28_012070, partial [Streblomastix strix]